MTCLTEERIQQWIDQELDNSARTAADEHLDECPSCRQRIEELMVVVHATEHLPMSIDTPRDLWPEILTQLKPASPTRHLPAWWQLAAAAAVLVMGVWIGSQWNRQNAAPSQTDQAYAALAVQVDNLRNQLTTLVAERGDQFDPATVVAVNETLTTLNGANAEFTRALEKDPANRRLQSMRASSAKKEAHVLADLVVALNGASMAGIDPTT